MRGWIKAGLAFSLAVMSAVPAVAQGTRGSEGEAFLKAVEDGDAATAMPMADVPSSNVVNYRGYLGETALHIATRKRELDWIGFLLNKGADPNIRDGKGDSALIIAARIGFEPAVDYLLRMGAKVDADNRKGETALILAVQGKQRRIVERLLRAGANPDKADFAAGYSARDYAKRDTRNQDLLRLIESIKATRTNVAGPVIN